jgi:multicomponent Na+:H+ antiporter subunit B
MTGFITLFTLLSMSVVALFSLRQSNLTQSVVLFSGVGLGSVVLFFIFNAPDVALTEAVIGSGITAVVLLIGIRHMHKEPEIEEVMMENRRGIRRIAIALLVLLTLLLLGKTLLGALSVETSNAGQALLEHAMQAGAANAVTSVVTYFRGFDTLGEVAVLFLAATGVGLLLTVEKGEDAIYIEPNFILRIGSGFLFPLILLFGLYIIVHGHLSPGGGFQGGVVIAAAFLLLFLTRRRFGLSHKIVTILESGAGMAYVLLGLTGLWLMGLFLGNFLPHPAEKIGMLVSGGIIPIIYILIGIKVGSEISYVVEKLIKRSHDV